MVFQLHQEGCVRRPPSKGRGHVSPGPADSVYMTVDVSVPLVVRVSNRYKSCFLHLHASHFSPPLLIPSHFLPLPVYLDAF